MFTLAEVRRYLRCGMGLCQGQTCGKLVARIMAGEMKVPVSQIAPASSRSPMRPIAMQVWADEKEGGRPE